MKEPYYIPFSIHHGPGRNNGVHTGKVNSMYYASRAAQNFLGLQASLWWNL